MIQESIMLILLLSFIILYLKNELKGLLYYVILMPLSLQPSRLTSYLGFSFNFQYFLTIFFVTIFTYHRIKKKDFYIKNSLLYLPFIYLIVLLVSSFKSYQVSSVDSLVLIRGTTVSLLSLPFFRSISRIGLVILFIILMIIFYYYANNKKYFFIMLKMHLYTSSLVSLIGIVFWFLYFLINSAVIDVFIHHFGDVVPRIRSILSEPIIFGIYLTTTLPFLMSLILTKNNLLNRRILYSMFFIQITGLILSFSRSGWLALVMISITIIYYNFHQIYLSLKPLFKFRGLISLFFLFVIFISLNIIFTDNLLKRQFDHHIINSFQLGNDKVYSTMSRLISYKYSILSFKENLFSGIGYENFIFYGSNKIIPWISGTLMPLQIPEINNLYIRFLTELGIISFIIVIFLGLNIFKSLIMSIKDSKNIFFKSLNVSFLAGFLGLSAQYLFYANLNYTFLWFYFGLMFASFELNKIKNFNLE